MLVRAVLAMSIASVAAVAGCSSGSGSADASDYSFGVIVVSQVKIFDDMEAAFEKSVRANVGDKKVSFEVKNANGDQSLIESLARSMASSDHDAFAVIGTPAVIALAQQVKDRPIFALAMGDPVGADLAKSLDNPGGNVTGSTDYISPSVLLKDIQTLQPGLKTIGTVYDPSNENMQVWLKDLKGALGTAGLKLIEAPISGTADIAQASRSLDGRVDAVFIGPDATVLSALDAVGAAAVKAKIPVYLSTGDPTSLGALASNGPDFADLGASAGVNAGKVLLGADVATTPFTTPTDPGLLLNETTAKNLGITVPAEMRSRAKLFH